MWNQGTSSGSLYQCTVYKVCTNLPVVNLKNLKQVKVKFTVEQAMKAQGRSRGI
jgi:hypothetical protein